MKQYARITDYLEGAPMTKDMVVELWYLDMLLLWTFCARPACVIRGV